MWPPQAHRCIHHLHTFPLKREYTTSRLTQPLALTSDMVKYDPNLKTPHRLTSYNSEHRPGTVPTELHLHPTRSGQGCVGLFGACGGAGELLAFSPLPGCRGWRRQCPAQPPRWPNVPTVHHQSGPLSTSTPVRHDIFSTVTNMTCDIHMSHLLTPWRSQAQADRPTLSLTLKKS